MIIATATSRDRKESHKCGIEVPTSAQQAHEINEERKRLLEEGNWVTLMQCD